MFESLNLLQRNISGTIPEMIIKPFMIDNACDDGKIMYNGSKR